MLSELVLTQNFKEFYTYCWGNFREKGLLVVYFDGAKGDIAGVNILAKAGINYPGIIQKLSKIRKF